MKRAAAALVAVLLGVALSQLEHAPAARAQAFGQCTCPGDGWALGWLDVPTPTGDLNPTMSLGWNINEAGNAVDPNLPTVYDTWEANWAQVGQAPWVERHWQYRGPDGTFRRPLTLAIPTDTHAPHLGVAGKFTVADRTHTTTRMNILDAPVGQPSAVMFGTSTVPTFLRCLGQSSPCIQQLSSDGTAFVQLVHLDGQNRVNIGAGADGVRFYAAGRPLVTGATCEERLESLLLALGPLGVGLVDVAP